MATRTTRARKSDNQNGEPNVTATSRTRTRKTQTSKPDTKNLPAVLPPDQSVNVPGDDTIKVGRVVKGTHETRREQALKLVDAGNANAVELASVLADVFINADHEQWDMDLSDYVAELGISREGFSLPRAAQQTLASLLTDAGVPVTTREFATLAGVSQSTANRTLNPARREAEQAALTSGESEGTGDGGESGEESAAESKPGKSTDEKIESTLATLRTLAAKDDADRPALVAALKEMILDLV